MRSENVHNSNLLPPVRLDLVSVLLNRILDAQRAWRKPGNVRYFLHDWLPVVIIGSLVIARLWHPGSLTFSSRQQPLCVALRVQSHVKALDNFGKHTALLNFLRPSCLIWIHQVLLPSPLPLLLLLLLLHTIKGVPAYHKRKKL